MSGAISRCCWRESGACWVRTVSATFDFCGRGRARGDLGRSKSVEGRDVASDQLDPADMYFMNSALSCVCGVEGKCE